MPTTRTINASEVRQNWSELVNQVARRNTRVLVEKSGVPVAALVSPEDLERLMRLETERESRLAVVDRAREAFKEITDDVLEAEVNVATKRARAEMQAEREQAEKAK